MECEALELGAWLWVKEVWSEGTSRALASAAAAECSLLITLGESVVVLAPSSSEMRARSPAARAMSGWLGARKLSRTTSPWLGRCFFLSLLRSDGGSLGLGWWERSGDGDGVYRNVMGSRPGERLESSES